MTKPLTYFVSGEAINLLTAGYGVHLETLTAVQKLDLLILAAESAMNILYGEQLPDDPADTAYPAYVLVRSECEKDTAFALSLVEAIACQLCHPPGQASQTIEVAGMPIEVETAAAQAAEVVYEV